MFPQLIHQKKFIERKYPGPYQPNQPQVNKGKKSDDENRSHEISQVSTYYRVAASLKKSLKSLKSPWSSVKNLEDPWKILEFWKWSLKSLNSALTQCNTSHANSSRQRHYATFSLELDPVWTSLKIAKRSLKYPWIILEFCRWNFVATLYYNVLRKKLVIYLFIEVFASLIPCLS